MQINFSKREGTRVCLDFRGTWATESRVDLKKSPSSRIGQPREKQSEDLNYMWEGEI